METFTVLVIIVISIFIFLQWNRGHQIKKFDAKWRRDACIRVHLRRINPLGDIFNPTESVRVWAVNSVPPLEEFERDVQLGAAERDAEAIGIGQPRVSRPEEQREPPKPALKANDLAMAGGDGSSMDKAVVIEETSSMKGILMEHMLIERLCGKSNAAAIESQATKRNNGRQYDVMTVKMKDGSTREIWFDVTMFFGKF